AKRSTRGAARRAPNTQPKQTRMGSAAKFNVLERQTVFCANRFRGIDKPEHRSSEQTSQGSQEDWGSLVAGTPIPAILAVGKLIGALGALEYPHSTPNSQRGPRAVVPAAYTTAYQLAKTGASEAVVLFRVQRSLSC